MSLKAKASTDFDIIQTHDVWMKGQINEGGNVVYPWSALCCDLKAITGNPPALVGFIFVYSSNRADALEASIIV